MADNKQGDNTLHANAIGWGILSIVFAVIFWLIWYYFQVEIRDVIRWIRWSEMKLFSFFVSQDFTVNYNGEPVSFFQGVKDTPLYARDALTDAHLGYFAALAMQPLRLPFAILLFACAIWCMFKGPRTYYRKKLGLEGLIQRQSLVFPVIAPFVEFN
ncbi:MAG: hypothetical protein KDD04_12275, partial [Sinomicrobium sp.]|nr:hypothetical protein [Sinomicrobium sp.]